MTKPFSLLCGIIFVVVALVHAYRLYAGWPVIVDGQDIPMWVSIVGAVVATVLGLGVLREASA